MPASSSGIMPQLRPRSTAPATVAPLEFVCFRRGRFERCPSGPSAPGAGLAEGRPPCPAPGVAQRGEPCGKQPSSVPRARCPLVSERLRGKVRHQCLKQSPGCSGERSAEPREQLAQAEAPTPLRTVSPFRGTCQHGHPSVTGSPVAAPALRGAAGLARALRPVCPSLARGLLLLAGAEGKAAVSPPEERAQRGPPGRGCSDPRGVCRPLRRPPGAAERRGRHGLRSRSSYSSSSRAERSAGQRTGKRPSCRKGLLRPGLLQPSCCDEAPPARATLAAASPRYSQQPLGRRLESFTLSSPHRSPYTRSPATARHSSHSESEEKAFLGRERLLLNRKNDGNTMSLPGRGVVAPHRQHCHFLSDHECCCILYFHSFCSFPKSC